MVFFFDHPLSPSNDANCSQKYESGTKKKVLILCIHYPSNILFCGLSLLLIKLYVSIYSIVDFLMNVEDLKLINLDGEILLKLDVNLHC